MWCGRADTYQAMETVIAFEHVYLFVLVPWKWFRSIQIHIFTKDIIHHYHANIWCERLP